MACTAGLKRSTSVEDDACKHTCVVLPAGGLSVVLAPSWLRMFSPSEINQLISGGQGGGLDVEDMARCVQGAQGHTTTCVQSAV